MNPLPTTSLGPIGEGQGFGPFNFIKPQDVETIRNISTLLSNLVGFITILSGLWFGFQFIMGALQWLSSGGEKAGLEGARNRMIHAFIGLIMVAGALAIIAVMATVFSLDILLTNPEKIACQLNPTIVDKSVCK